MKESNYKKFAKSPTAIVIYQKNVCSLIDRNALNTWISADPWDGQHLRKLKILHWSGQEYFTELGDELRGFPLLNHHLEWGGARSL